MRIYVAHSKDFDYKNELYLPIRKCDGLQEHEIVLPHEASDSSSNTRELYKEIDFMIAECSYPATGLGIELGWVFDDDIPIYCIYRQGRKLSGSVRSVTNHIYSYSDVDEMIHVIEGIVQMEKTKRESYQKVK